MGGIGVIDIGSNGIRFGLVSELTRHLPVIYEERAPISLFEAQYSTQSDERIDIPESVIVDIENSLKRFKFIAHQHHVNHDNVHVIATEATRTAPNSKQFIDRIKQATGWEIELLGKEDEAKISGMGIISTFYGVEGLVMDMGGGSVEFNYVTHRPYEMEQSIQMSDDPINLPYGAAALTQLLITNNTPEKRDVLFKKIVKELKEGFEKLKAPEAIKAEDGSFTVYMSGGGLRSLGYLSMSESGRKSNYPIPIINGYVASAEELVKSIKQITPNHDVTVVEPLSERDKPIFPDGNPFRIGNRRAKLLPACAFLLEVIMEVINVRRVYFCEGGVRQGYCFYKLPKSERSVDPLASFIKSHPLQPEYLKKSNFHRKLLEHVKTAIPSIAYEILDSDLPSGNSKKPKRLERLLPILIDLSFWTMHFAKEARPIAAFQLSLAGGALANAPGLTHIDRAIIAWCLMYRYNEDGSSTKNGGVEGDISIMCPGIFGGVKKLIPGGKDGRKICEIVGILIGFVILCYPVGDERILKDEKLMIFEAPKIDEDKKYEIKLILTGKLSSSSKSNVYLINNPIVKQASEKLDKKYKLGKNEKNLTEIVMKVVESEDSPRSPESPETKPGFFGKFKKSNK
ncbi:5066_t:CDS:2 [Funneliformis geosporum]|uniref:3582_t:CDS:1 n=1 Tax=Funneliformis geosporum TaxID=1117311 RepID=A0A9W4SB85_9GLOM|nr:5066_t:CDS:2 [Funneliformis geosporum]CAI2162727.1 3582_t:CDS:2 [Funneliformis geosporum]